MQRWLGREKEDNVASSAQFTGKYIFPNATSLTVYFSLVHKHHLLHICMKLKPGGVGGGQFKGREKMDSTLENCANVSIRMGRSTVITRKQWNRKTTLQQYLSVFDGVTKQIVLLDTYKITYLVKWVCLHCSLVLFHGHWTFLTLNLDF